MSLVQFGKANIESRAFLAARRIFGRYGVDVANPSVSEAALSVAMRRMTAKEYTTIIGAFKAVFSVNGRFVPKTPIKTQEQMYKELQERAYHFKNHPEDLPKASDQKAN